MTKSFLLFFVLWTLMSCHTTQLPVQQRNANPPAENFDLTGSDEKAIAIADAVMLAMGGRNNWDNTRYLTWNFFGRRVLLWDKKSGNVRIQIPAEKMEIFLNVYDNKIGRVIRNETIETQPDTIAKYLSRGKSIWINDSYWLVMPFKLKDSGVTLKYNGVGATKDGIASDILQLTFQKVGDTPQNKYLVYIDQKDHLVKQWDYFKDAADPNPVFSSPWLDYKTYGSILLSGNRGNRQLTEINAFNVLPKDLSSLYLFDKP